MKLAAIEIPQEIDKPLKDEIRRSIDESFVAGFRIVMIVASGLATLSAATAQSMIERNPKEEIRMIEPRQVICVILFRRQITWKVK